MKAFLLLVAVSIMSSARPVHCGSSSMSCSTVNGKMMCTKKEGDGNFAASSAGAFSSPDGGYMNSNAGVGDTNTRNFDYAQQEAHVPPTFSYDSYPPGNAPPPSSSSSSSSSGSWGGNAPPPSSSSSSSFSSSGSWGSPGAGSFAGAGSGFGSGFAGAGPFPPFYNPVFPTPYVPYPSDQARPVPPVAPVYPGAAAYAGGFAGPFGPMNPMAYVQNAMNGMAMGMFGRR